MKQTPTWYCKNLGDALLAGTELDRLKALCQQAYNNATQPSDMAVFIRHESEGRLHCEVKLYFSPAASELARTVNATPCEPPSPHDLGFFAGDDTGGLRLFADKP